MTALEQARRLLPPIDHPDPAHMLVTGTGLTHLGSAEGRDKMHRTSADAADAHRLDADVPARASRAASRRRAQAGVQPEWFYKGDGSIAGRRRATPLAMPAFALDGGEEPEIAGIYLIGADGTPLPPRLRARQRVLRPRHRAAELPLARPFQAAPCAPRPGAAGRRRCPPTCAAPAASAAAARWSGRSRSSSGEANMSHSIANLEHHHFKYAAVPPPGRRARPFLRHRDAVVLATAFKTAAGRRVRDRGGCVRAAVAQRSGDGGHAIGGAAGAGLSRPQSFAQLSRLPRSFRISRAALWPGMPLTPPPGCIELPQT